MAKDDIQLTRWKLKRVNFKHKLNLNTEGS